MLSRAITVMAMIAISVFAVVPAPTAAPRAGFLQVVAHPDDDILFMNPDLTSSVRSRSTVTSIYLTAGESDIVPPTRYAAQRQAGTRAAFAEMAGVPDVWSRVELSTGGGRAVELQTLRAWPTVQLIFMNLPDDNSPHAIGGKHALTRLWEDEATRVETLIPQGSPLRASSRYGREDVIDTLTWLFEYVDPGMVRTHDPLPDPRYQPHWGRFHNHPDHVMTSRFVDAALRQHGPTVREMHYRDYNIADTPANLAPELVAAKTAVFRRYAEHDPVVTMDEPYASWLRSMQRRWPPGDDWAAVDSNGRLTAVSIIGTGLILQRWNAQGLSNQSIVDTPGFVPAEGTATLISEPGGRLFVMVRSRDTHDVWLAPVTVHGTGTWSNVSAPRSDGPVTHSGMPSAGYTVDGRLVLAAKNTRGGVSVGDALGNWQDLGGAEVEDGVTVVPGSHGRLHIFAPTRTELLHWEQTGGQHFALTVLPQRPAGRLASAGNHEGAYLAFRAAGTGELVVLSERDGWSEVVALDEPGSTSPSLAVRHDGVALLATLDARGSTVLFELFRASSITRRVLDDRIVDQPSFTPGGGFLLGPCLDGQTLVYGGAAMSVLRQPRHRKPSRPLPDSSTKPMTSHVIVETEIAPLTTQKQR